MDYFDSVQVVADPLHRKTIVWYMQNLSALPNGVEFFVDKARSGGDWEEIAGPITDACTYTDDVRWNWNKDRNTFYRVRFIKDGEWQFSTPAQAVGKWSKQDYTFAKEICRREYLLMRKAGVRGQLLKRREWGIRCPNNDYDTDEPPNDRCPLCMGTGFEGGYYAPISLPGLIPQPAPSSNRKFGETGLEDTHTLQLRVVAYPLITPDDLWVNLDSGERWQIKAVQPVAQIRNTPIVQMIALQKIPQSDIVYDIDTAMRLAEVPEYKPTGNEYGWETKDNASCIHEFDY